VAENAPQSLRPRQRVEISGRDQDRGTDAMAFVQVGEEDEEEGTALTNVVKKNKDHIKCRNCGEMGHYQHKCPLPAMNRTPTPPAVPVPALATPTAAPGVQLDTELRLRFQECSSPPSEQYRSQK
jgi:Zinc knuckle